jgi:hypothetical protein
MFARGTRLIEGEEAELMVEVSNKLRGLVH